MQQAGSAGIPDTGPATTEADDVRLTSRIAAGDRLAFETLYRRYFPRLARFLDRMVRHAPAIEEIVNDTMLVVWQKADRYDGSSKVSTWIFAIAYRRALKTLQGLDLPVDAEADEQPGDDMQEPEQAFRRGELREAVGSALDTLPLEQRAVVSLTYYHGLAYGEIAEIMDCPVNTVKTRMFHARRRLKALLADHLEEAP
jgi:RNA polymerase sigma-70 factor (ECF subfamily)